MLAIALSQSAKNEILSAQVYLLAAFAPVLYLGETAFYREVCYATRSAAGQREVVAEFRQEL